MSWRQPKSSNSICKKVPGCEDEGEGQEEDGVAEGYGDGEGDDGGVAQLAVHAPPQQGQHQHWHPVWQDRPRHWLVRHVGQVKI